MAGRPVIELERVGKRYRLGEHHGVGTDLRETLVRSARRLRGLPQEEVREIWSLRDISLTVEEGTALGIIGANGAGKSTLLKVISHITTPTEGTCRTRGRIGSLLEVGTGFHGELTGRENTYLNGAILGMTRREVRARLDEIVAFSGLDRFMDTPVKRYSTGMYLRLGFAIAAHMEAEILLVDEVLAVGDADFQRRCLGKMDEVERSGRTVIFVSHNLDAMTRLCPTAIWIDAGEVRTSGVTEEVVGAYMRSAATPATGLALEPDHGRAAQVVGVSVVDDAGVVQSILTTRDAAWLSVEVLVNDAVPGLDVSVQVATKRGVEILDEVMTDVGPSTIGQPGRYVVGCRLPAILTPGEYVISVWLGTAYEQIEQLDEVLGFTVEGDDLGRPRRLIRLVPDWRTTRLDDHLADG